MWLWEHQCLPLFLLHFRWIFSARIPTFKSCIRTGSTLVPHVWSGSLLPLWSYLLSLSHYYSASAAHNLLFLESVKYIPALGLWHLVCSLMAMLFPQNLRGCLPHSFRSLLKCHLSERISLTVLCKIASAPYPIIFYPFLYFTFPDCIATIYLLYAYVWMYLCIYICTYVCI